MHIHNLEKFKHDHQFELPDQGAERRVMLVVSMTLVTMVAEIAAGLMFGSMALLADGWHMGTHAVALGITLLAYYLARKYARDRRFTFGTGKIGVMGGYTSAVVLAVVALLMVVESLERLFSPRPIRFDEAIAVACLGLIVNLVSAFLLRKTPHHGHGHTHGDHDHHDHHDHTHDTPAHGHHRDHNIQGAYLHVLADALTSVLAIVALTFGKIWHWVWMDPAMGVVGALIITHWARGLLRDTGKILLDRDVSRETLASITQCVESDADNRIVDQHVWKIGSQQLAAIISIATHYPRSPEHYKLLLSGIPDLAHITIEVIHCTSEPCLPGSSAGDTTAR